MPVEAKTVGQLYKDYSNDVLNYSMSILKNYDDAKDTLHEVFEKYIKTENSFKGNCSYKTWLLVITRNHCFQKLKGKGVFTVSIDESNLKLFDPKIDDKITLNDAIKSLSKEEFELIYLREYACHSYSEMAEILGISIDNVKVKLFRVREQLRKYLK